MSGLDVGLRLLPDSLYENTFAHPLDIRFSGESFADEEIDRLHVLEEKLRVLGVAAARDLWRRGVQGPCNVRIIVTRGEESRTDG